MKDPIPKSKKQINWMFIPIPTEVTLGTKAMRDRAKGKLPPYPYFQRPEKQRRSGKG